MEFIIEMPFAWRYIPFSLWTDSAVRGYLRPPLKNQTDLAISKISKILNKRNTVEKFEIVIVTGKLPVKKSGPVRITGPIRTKLSGPRTGLLKIRTKKSVPWTVPRKSGPGKPDHGPDQENPNRKIWTGPGNHV